MIIVDTSVIIKWFNEEEKESNIAFLLYKRHIDKIEEIIVPQLLFYEVANALSTKSEISKQRIRHVLKFLYRSGLSVYSTKEEELIETALLAKKHQTSVYNMLYAVIAKNKKISLITADEKFVAKTKFKFAKLLGDIEKEKLSERE